MHADQLDIDADLVRTLVAIQFPELAGLPVTPLRSAGTVNAIFRLGSDLTIRLPLTAEWSEDLARERRVLGELRSRVTLTIPQPVAVGRPSVEYPLPWAVYRWVPGQPYADELIEDEPAAARDLARFVTELRANPADAAPQAGRKPLKQLDAGTRSAIEAAAPEIDARTALAAWERTLESPAWDGASTLIHADLLRANILVDHGRLHAIIDFGAAGAGDPAHDVIAAWTVFGPAGRTAYREALGVDDGTWSRARGIALHQAAVGIPYYRLTNPGFAAQAIRTTEEILADDQR